MNTLFEGSTSATNSETCSNPVTGVVGSETGVLLPWARLRAAEGAARRDNLTDYSRGASRGRAITAQRVVSGTIEVRCRGNRGR